MNARAIRTAAIALAAAASAAAFAQAPADNAPKTRQQVLAELAEAQRNGELQVAGEFTVTPREPRAASTLTREQAEVLRAHREGTMLPAGEQIGSPDVRPVVTGKTRAQVKAELAEAQRNGELVVAGETGALQRDLPGYARTAPARAPALAAR